MTTELITTSRRCIGSLRFSIEDHDADAGDFPVEPSQKDGLGRMCKHHWRAYTNALRKAAVARKAEETTGAPKPDTVLAEAPHETQAPELPAPRKTRRPKATAQVTETDDDER